MSTVYPKQVVDRTDTGFNEALQRFQVGSELCDGFGQEQIKCYEFGSSPVISTYIYSIMAGPYTCFESKQ